MKVRPFGKLTGTWEIVKFCSDEIEQLDVFCDRIVDADVLFRVEPMSDKGNKISF